MLKKRKMYLVRYEVIATSVKAALKTRGIVCDITVAEERFWPQEDKKNKKINLGFKK